MTVPGPRGAVHVLGTASNTTNADLVRRWRELGVEAVLTRPERALAEVRAGDLALARLDVTPALDGIEPGLLALLLLERRGADVRNRATALLAVHDKLRTADRLERAQLPHPRTWHVRRLDELLALVPPLVLKPRFGSWGRDVLLCRGTDELRDAFEAIRGRAWFARHGLLVQELVPPTGSDLRVLVAGGEVVGASERVAAAGDWRTNVSLGGSLRPATLPGAARALAQRAAQAVGMDLVGVDLLPAGEGFVVLELNGAVDFDDRYALEDGDVYAEAARALALPFPPSRPGSGTGVGTSPQRR